MFNITKSISNVTISITLSISNDVALKDVMQHKLSSRFRSLPIIIVVCTFFAKFIVKAQHVVINVIDKGN
jgi:hypothetical protein